IYKHIDAGHPHIHIVSTNIEADGKRISLHNIGELKSEPARKAIEIDFGLVQANGKKNECENIENVKIRPLEYGTTDTKRAITNIVNEVTKSFKFTSLPELNAILNLYNVTADKGSKESVMFNKGGLNYWAMDKYGKKIGIPIKASSIYFKPTLKLLEGRFKLNEYLRKPFREEMKAKIDKVISRAISLDQFKNELKKAEVSVIIRQNAEGRIYGVSYIDQANRAIFNGSDLGKAYSAAAILNAMQYKLKDNVASSVDKYSEKPGENIVASNQTLGNSHSHTLLDDLLNHYDPNGNLPNQFGPKKKRKKRKNLNL
ncbi:MAG TPA: relaxase/mobilization nuclease domain-containing protein, partial [Hanamia sp.]|nr:relaxase/mobilization nuclease domain-containing protein [Hanamia sp.]